MDGQILYLGDTALDQAAAYLAGVLTQAHISFDYLPSDQPLPPDRLAADYRAVVLSDYPAANFAPGRLDALVEKVGRGMGLVMIGGWESFTGLNRQYTRTALCEVLPVILQPDDDRVNSYQPWIVLREADHPIVSGLPWDQNPPTIGGFNRLAAKPSGTLILSAQRSLIQRTAAGISVRTPAQQTVPLLVVGTFRQGRVAAFACDVAPHWVGGLVDWGDARLTAQARGAGAIEVGNWYARFFANLVRWTAKLL